MAYRFAPDFRPLSRRDNRRMVELWLGCRNREDGRKDKRDGMSFDRNRLRAYQELSIEIGQVDPRMMTTSASSDSVHPRLHFGSQLLLPDGDRIYCRIGDRTLTVSGVSPSIVRDIAGLCNGDRSVAEINKELAPRHSTASVSSVLNMLFDAGILEDASPETVSGGRGDVRSAVEQRVALLGNRKLLGVLDAAFEAAGFQNRRIVHPRGFSSCETPEFLARYTDQVVSAAGFREPPVAHRYEDLALATPESLRDILAGADFAVCALESVPHQALFDINRAAIATGTPCLFVTVSDRQAVIGPNVISRAGPCFRCRVLATDSIAAGAPDLLSLMETPSTSNQAGPLLAQIAAAVVDEALATFGSPATPALVSATLILESGGRPRRRDSLLAEGACPDCGGPHTVPETPVARAGSALAAEEIVQVWQASPAAPPARAADAYRRVAILGGGTAGYMTALALRKARPELGITVIDSSSIPVIGVGEATTPEFVRMLHAPRFLGFDVADFHRRVMPTFKLGISFQWGAPAPYDFPFPFQRGRLPESLVYEDSLDDQSIGAMLMARQAAPVFHDSPDQEPRSLLHRIRWAYHLDNRRFVAYLREEARAAGIAHLDAVVEDVDLAGDGLTVNAIRTRDGRSLNADLWVDCSGFRSLLMEKQLGSAFIDYSSTLYTDSAVVANVPHDGTIKPYTHSQTMNAGWCWTIPFEDADHKGYVFSSSFLDEERAIEEMRAANPDMEEPWTVHFRSGRHEDFWKGNVVALGNSYGFVEPLQSTALHMLVFQIELLTTHFPPSRQDHSFKSALNKKVGERWDALRWFLGVHYRFNRARDTAFWRAANEEVDISGAAQRVALLRERAPLSYRPSFHYRYLPPEFFSDDHAFDSMLMGLRLPSRRVETADSRVDWQRRLTGLRSLADMALPHAEALRWLREGGEDALSMLTLRPDSWVQLGYPV